MRISTPIFAVALALAALSLAAHAETIADPRAVTRSRSIVHYGDLDIATERGAKIMLRRIEHAAARACGGHPTFNSYTGSLDNTFADCRDRAIGRAVKQLGAPVVSRIYSEAKPRSS